MRVCGTFIVAIGLALWTSALPADAGIIINSGTLHASASANGASNNPADKPFSLPSTSHSASVSNPPYSANAMETVSFLSDINISGSGLNSGGAPIDIGAGASADLNITETSLESFTGTLTRSDIHLAVFATVKNASNVNVLNLSLTSGGNSSTQTGMLPPGAYTVSWSLVAQKVGGTGGGGTAGFTFVTVPEPGMLACFAAPLLIVRRRRGR